MKAWLAQRTTIVIKRMQHLAIKCHVNKSPASAQDTIDPLRHEGAPASIWEIDHLEQDEEKLFLKQLKDNPINLDRSYLEQLACLMLKSETFDAFMAKKFGQVKRYGLEGGEGMMVCLQELLSKLSVVIGMPHRGRLNLMTGLLHYPLEAVFAKLKGRKELPDSHAGSGDVLSHLWTDVNIDGARHVLLPNPSHLEAINPVHMGATKSLGNTFLPIQIHGDASFAGQGVIQETLMLSQLPGFTVNGTIHVVVNNQLGFTTPPNLGRSTRFATDPLKMISAPIFHVSGDNIVEIVKASRTALAYKQAFNKDVGIDIVCYRKMGHNELDEPAFTQPLMYSKIRSRPLPGTLFAQSIQFVTKHCCLTF